MGAVVKTKIGDGRDESTFVDVSSTETKQIFFHYLIPIYQVSTNQTMSFIRFDVRGQHHLTHSTTIMKFPGSRFTHLLENTCSSSKDRIEIDRDPKHFETILNLMRTQKITYAASLSDEELSELLEELKYYLLSSLEHLVSELIRPQPPKRAWSTTRIINNYKRHIDNIRRPTLIISSQTIDELNYYSNGTMRTSTFLSAFDNRYYDVLILADPSEEKRFVTSSYLERIDRDSNAPGPARLLGLLRLCLYIPKKEAPDLVIQKYFRDPYDFTDKLYKSLTLIDLYLNDREKGIGFKEAYAYSMGVEL